MCGRQTVFAFEWERSLPQNKFETPAKRVLCEDEIFSV